MRDDILVPQAKRAAAVMMAFAIGSISILALLNLHSKFIKHQAVKRAEESSAIASSEAESILESRLDEARDGNALVKEDSGAYQRKSAEENAAEMQAENTEEQELKDKENYILNTYGDEEFIPDLDKAKNLYTVGDFEGLYDNSAKNINGIALFTKEQFINAITDPQFISGSIIKGGVQYYYDYMRPDTDSVSVTIKAEDERKKKNYSAFFILQKTDNGWKPDITTMCDSVYGTLLVPEDAENIKINGIDCPDVSFKQDEHTNEMKRSEQYIYLMFNKGKNTITYTENGETVDGTLAAVNKTTGKATDDPKMLQEYTFIVEK